jgi:hypothetical protein
MRKYIIAIAILASLLIFGSAFAQERCREFETELAKAK